MINAIGLLELNSIAEGIHTADLMMKSAEVSLLTAKPCCPGKYIILISGAVEAVSTSLNTGIQSGKEYVIDSTFIPRVHEDVIRAISAMSNPECTGALGVMEFFSVAWAIQGADAAVKASNIELIEIRLGIGIGGKSFVTLSGDVSAVHNSVQAGIHQAAKEGMLINHTIVPHPRKEIYAQLL